MRSTVNHHERQFFLRKNEDYIDRIIQRLKKQFQRIEDGGNVNLKASQQRPLGFATRMVRVQEHLTYLHSGLKYSLDIGLSHYERVMSKEEETTIEIGNAQYTITPEKKIIDKDYHNLGDLASLAILLRDDKAQQRYLNLGIWQPDEPVEQFHFAFAQYLRAIIKNNSAARNAAFTKLQSEVTSDIGLFHTLEGPVASKVRGRGKRMERLFLPVAQLYQYIFEQKEEAFNQLLESYLLDKKEFIIERELENSADYWVDWRLLGCCAYAYDQGINISVQSNYIPQFVYEGDFPHHLIDLSPWATENDI